MGFVFPEGIKEPFEKLPAGVVLFRIDGGSEGDVGTTESPVFGIEIQLTAEEPVECAGITQNPRFYLGIRDTDYLHKDKGYAVDPDGLKVETLAATSGRFKAFCTAAGVEIEGKDSDLVYSELKDRKVLGKVEHKVNKDNPDQTNARIVRWMPAGSMDPHVVVGEATPANPAKPATRAIAQRGPSPGVANGNVPGAPPAPAARPQSARLTARR